MPWAGSGDQTNQKKRIHQEGKEVDSRSPHNPNQEIKILMMYVGGDVWFGEPTRLVYRTCFVRFVPFSLLTPPPNSFIPLISLQQKDKFNSISSESSVTSLLKIN
jgi:hypothetical protein